MRVSNHYNFIGLKAHSTAKVAINLRLDWSWDLEKILLHLFY